MPAVARPSTQRAPFPPSWALKVILAVTGTILVAFVIFHMFGNLKVFLGKEAINHYAFWLQRDLLVPLIPEGWFVWIFRGVLAACIVAHAYAAVVVRRRARKARGVGKSRKIASLRNFQARNMLVTGVVLALFIVFHILDLTVGARPVASSEFEHLNAYDNMVHSFSRPAVSAFYIVAMGMLFLHLVHGLWSVVNDLGGTGRRLRATVLAIAGIAGLVVLLGNIAIPIAVLVGAVS